MALDELGRDHPMATIAEELGSEGVGLISELMDRNRRDQEWVETRLLESTEKERDEYKEKWECVSVELHEVRQRILALIGWDDPIEG